MILIHGTFDSNSQILHPQSELGERVAASIKSETSEAFRWSGANTAAARTQAAAILEQNLLSKFAQGIDAVVIVAHSHGGNVAWMAVARLPEVQQKNVGIVAVGTPFLFSEPYQLIGLHRDTSPFLLQRSVPRYGWASCGIFSFWFTVYQVILKRGLLPELLAASICILLSFPMVLSQYLKLAPEASSFRGRLGVVSVSGDEARELLLTCSGLTSLFRIVCLSWINFAFAPREEGRFAKSLLQFLFFFGLGVVVSFLYVPIWLLFFGPFLSLGFDVPFGCLNSGLWVEEVPPGTSYVKKVEIRKRDGRFRLWHNDMLSRPEIISSVQFIAQRLILEIAPSDLPEDELPLIADSQANLDISYA